MRGQPNMKKILLRLKEFLSENEAKIALIIGFVLVCAISFEIGVLQGQKWQQKPLVIEKQVSVTTEWETASGGSSVSPEKVPTSQNDATLTETATSKTAPTNSKNCAYVGSKNSTKFYAPNCSWAKSIKPENLVCFQTAQEAISQGRTESKCTK